VREGFTGKHLKAVERHPDSLPCFRIRFPFIESYNMSSYKATARARDGPSIAACPTGDAQSHPPAWLFGLKKYAHFGDILCARRVLFLRISNSITQCDFQVVAPR
jgi:hypothetical protein